MGEDVINWTYISKLIDKIEVETERLHWDELVNEVDKVFDAAEKETDPAKAFFEPYQFLFRLYYRIKHFDNKQELNQIYMTHRTCRGESTAYYRVVNYDYSMFLWARKNGFTEFLSNDIIDIPKKSLTPEQQAGFDKKIKN